MDEELIKDQSIKDVLCLLRDELGPGAFDITDHWEADLVGIGISSPKDHCVLAYISTYNRPEGQYYLELELPPAPDSDKVYVSAGIYENVDFEQLKKLISDHFGIPVN